MSKRRRRWWTPRARATLAARPAATNVPCNPAGFAQHLHHHARGCCSCMPTVRQHLANRHMMQPGGQDAPHGCRHLQPGKQQATLQGSTYYGCTNYDAARACRCRGYHITSGNSARWNSVTEMPQAPDLRELGHLQAPGGLNQADHHQHGANPIILIELSGPTM